MHRTHSDVCTRHRMPCCMCCSQQIWIDLSLHQVKQTWWAARFYALSGPRTYFPDLKYSAPAAGMSRARISCVHSLRSARDPRAR